MRRALVSLLVIVAVPAFGTLTVPHAVLLPDELNSIGVSLQVRDVKDLVPVLDLPINFTLTANDQSNCLLEDVYVFVNDSIENTVFGSSIARKGNKYDFLLKADYLEYSTISLVCLDEMSDNHEVYYKIYIRDHMPTP